MKYTKEEKRSIKAKYGIRPFNLWLLVTFTKNRLLLDRQEHNGDYVLLHPQNKVQLIPNDAVESLVKKRLIHKKEGCFYLTPEGFEIVSRRLDIAKSRPY